jgi:hypothetical protein
MLMSIILSTSFRNSFPRWPKILHLFLNDNNITYVFINISVYVYINSALIDHNNICIMFLYEITCIFVLCLCKKFGKFEPYQAWKFNKKLRIDLD